MSPCPRRSVRGANQGHAASDLQEEALLVQGCFFQPAEERFRKALRNPEVRHQTRQKATGGDAGADGCSSKGGFACVSCVPGFLTSSFVQGNTVGAGGGGGGAEKLFAFLALLRARSGAGPGAEHQDALWCSATRGRRQLGSKEVEANTLFLMPLALFFFFFFSLNLSPHCEILSSGEVKTLLQTESLNATLR